MLIALAVVVLVHLMMTRTSFGLKLQVVGANPAAAVLNRLVMRRKFRTVVDELLGGLRTLAEQRHTQPGT